MKACQVKNCSRKAHARMLCKLHYQRWRHTGDPLGNKRTKHGMWGTKVYVTWCGLKSRSLNPGYYPDYAGRGITICDRWLRFENFYEDMGNPPSEDMSIDRIDNDGPYSPENCRWATRIEQGNNTRGNVTLDIEGQRYTATQWAMAGGVPRRTIYSRLRLGWSRERAFLTPCRSS